MRRYSPFADDMRPDARGAYVLFEDAETEIRALVEDAEKAIHALQGALRDCMRYVDVDNLTMQTKERNWQAVLNGGPWNSANVEVSK